MEFDKTLGYPGEGPGERGRAEKSGSASAPVTPPKTPPKASELSSVPPWTMELEAEVRGVVDSYLQRGKAKSGVIITESCRILGPPPKPKATRSTLHDSVRQPPEPPAPRARAKASEAGDSRLILAGPKAGGTSLTPPPPPKVRRVQPEQNRVVKPKFDTGFRYPVSPKTEDVPTNSPSFSGIRLSLQDNPDLPGIRPSMPLNLDRRLPVEEVVDRSRVAKRKSEAPVTGESTTASEPRFARPTPKVKRPQDIPAESTGTLLQGKGGSETLPKSEPSPVSGHEPAGEQVSFSSARAGSVESQDSGDDKPELSSVQDPALVTGELSSSSSELEVRSSRDAIDRGLLTRDVSFEKGSPGPAGPKVCTPPVGTLRVRVLP